MHELSIAVEIVEQAELVAKQNNAEKVHSIDLEIGRLKTVVPDLMEFSFQQAARGTILEGAKLNISEITPWVRCRQCQAEYEPEIDDFVCAQCQKARVEIIRGDEIILKSVDMDTKGVVNGQ